MGRYKFNNRGTGTIFWLGFFYPVADPGGVTGMITPPPPELVPILKTYCKVFVTGTDHPPPLLGMWMTSHRQCPRGVVVLVNVQQEWGCFSIFRRADDVTGTMSKGGCACECPRVGVFFNFPEGGWRHADMSKGGCLWNVFTPPPPSGNPVSAPVICVKFRSNQPLCPPP